VIHILVIIIESLIVMGLVLNLRKGKKTIKSLLHYKRIRDIIEVSSQDKNVMKSIKKINSVLLSELEMDFSSFFIMKNSNLQLVDTNIHNLDLRKRLKNIKNYRSHNGEDFREAFSEDLKVVPIKSKNPLYYLSEEYRNIRNAVVIPLVQNDNLCGYWLIEDNRSNYIDQIDFEELLILAKIVSIHIENGLNLYLDPLLKIPKRDFFYEWLEAERQSKDPFAIGFLDIDHFKNVNDTYGHATGDEILIIVANIISDSIRDDDIVSRYGGEEILIGMRSIDRDNAIQRMNEIRLKISETMLIIDNKENLSVTASIGIAMSDEADSNDDLIECADRRVYIAKRNGRNRIHTRG